MNGYAARVVLASRPAGLEGPTLVTLEVTMPRFILAEFNTHRVFSRNSASSRAIPVARRIRDVRQNPFVPEAFGRNKRGMSATEDLGGWRDTAARALWLGAAGAAVLAAQGLDRLGTHKQHANRLLEPFAWHTVLVTATDWGNFIALRTDKNAQPEMQVVARLMREALAQAEEEAVERMWHIPLVQGVDAEALWDQSHEPEQLFMISAGRCARVSYLTHDGRRDPCADLELAERLVTNGHMSPFEHQATVRFGDARRPSNLAAPWEQFRKALPSEAVWAGGSV